LRVVCRLSNVQTITWSSEPMMPPCHHDIREKSITVIPFASYSDDESDPESLTLGLVLRRGRRASVSNSNHERKYWRRSESGPAQPCQGRLSGHRRKRRKGLNSHHPLHASSISNSNIPQSLSPTHVIASNLLLICPLYLRYALHSLRKSCRRFKRTFLLLIFLLLAIASFLALWLYMFYLDAVRVCTPHSDYVLTDRPLVEYYVHDRGFGHYARSVAIVEQLTKSGVDFRMFIPPTAMWRALHEDAKKINLGSEASNMGATTAISVASLNHKYSLFETISHTMKRIIGDCEVSSKSNRYPQLIISDGDFPGMLRALVGGIQSVGIGHGQLFHIAQKPSWVKKSVELNRAWDDQAILNRVSSLFSEWHIATNFCFLESKIKNGVVARAPLRPEVLQMITVRNRAKLGDPYTTLPQYKQIQSLLLADSYTKASGLDPINGTATEPYSLKRRKVVICYFRDHNGELVVQALMDSGFDVLLFDGYFEVKQNDTNHHGTKSIISHRKKLRRNQSLDVRNEVNKSSIYDVETGKPDESRWTRRNGNVASGEEHNPRLIRVIDRSLFVPLMHVADGVASSAGSQLMSECIFADMPLFALYRQDDEEQRLNVELSHHPGICHKPKVGGTSFETLAAGLKSTRNIKSSTITPKLAEFQRFVNEVRNSNVSDTFYKFKDAITEDSNASDRGDLNSQQVSSFAEGEDPFQGLPDTGEIILGFINQTMRVK